MGFNGNKIGQSVYVTSASPLDSKLKPLANITKLNELINDTTSKSYIYPGMELIVLNYDSVTKQDMPVKFIANPTKEFKIKDKLTVKTFADIEQFRPFLSEGIDVVVLKDETKNGEMSRYTIKTKQVENEGEIVEVLDFEESATTAIKIIGDDF